ncbi:MAG: hypothetical protein IKZ49_04800 [Alphaproteobacteria bacterium]|nr:hypothetical protein [Alphaproteobacteria bacterium]
MAKQKIPQEMMEAYRQLMRPGKVINVKPKVEKIEEKPMKLDIKVEKVATQYNEIQQQVFRISTETKKVQHS